jgi:hypothetical protein
VNNKPMLKIIKLDTTHHQWTQNFCIGNPNEKNQLWMGLNLFIMAISSYNGLMASMCLPLSAKNTPCKIGVREEKGRVGG